MNATERDEARLTRLVAGVRAEPNPAALTRALARIAARERVPRGVAWLGTPAALAGAAALLVLTAGGSIALLRSDVSGATRDTTLVSALIGDDDSYWLPSATSTRADVGAVDSGEVSR